LLHPGRGCNFHQNILHLHLDLLLHLAGRRTDHPNKRFLTARRLYQGR
jgi:hypothetical protein